MAQYIYVDANADSINTADDRLSGIGSTLLDIWLVTDRNRDGSAAACVGGGSLTLFSYMFILRVDGGDVSWGEYANNQAGMATDFGCHSSPTEFMAGFGGTAILPPGRYKLGSLSVSVLSGSPAIAFASASPGFPDYFTGFGSECPGVDQDYTLKLGTDWNDADGAQAPDLPPAISAPPAVAAEVGSDVTVQVDAVDSLSHVPPTITAEGYPPGLELSVSQVSANASRGILTGHLEAGDAGTHSIVWTATDEAGQSDSCITMMDVAGEGETTGAVIVRYWTDGPGPFLVSQGERGIDATIGPWGGPLFPNGPCGEPVAYPVIPFTNSLCVEIDVGSGGRICFDYDLSQTGTPRWGSEFLTIVLIGSPDKYPLWHWGNPALCWGDVWESARMPMTIGLDQYANQHVYLVFYVTGNFNSGTETQARIHSIAVSSCPVSPLTPLSAEAQQLEDNPWDEARLTPEMRDSLACFRTRVQTAGGTFDTSRGSAYRTLEYQLHLREVWDKWRALRKRRSVACESLWSQVSYEKETKHHLQARPGLSGGPSSIQHTKGMAFDATVTGVNPDVLAGECGLHRPYYPCSDSTAFCDSVHYEMR